MESKYLGKHVDVATQTSPLISPLSSACAPSPVTSFPTATSLLSSASGRPCCTILQNLSPAEEDMHPADPSHPDIFSPQLSPLPSSLGLQPYSGTRALHSTNRTVSLPAHLCDEDLRLLLSRLIDNSTPEKRQQQRVVSMPETVQLHMQATSPSTPADPESPDPSLHTVHSADRCYAEGEGSVSSSSSSPSTPRTIIMHPLSSDHFHTPSPPPSSCDSVEFTLDDPVCLPDSFLRRSVFPSTYLPDIVDKPTDLLEDDGWLTWANSPPRPIPALHGPSSLPYARCPSGAEGTIIGEPSSLPRMIWGLDPNDNLPAHHLPNSQQTRVVPIQRLGKLRHGSSHVPVSPATFTPLVPKLGLTELDYHSSEGIHNGRSLSASGPVTPEIGAEQSSEGVLCGMTRVGAGLGFSVSEEGFKLGSRHNAAMRDAGTLEPSQFYRLQTPILDEEVELLSVEEGAGRQRQPQARSQEGRYGFVARGMGSQGRLPSNLMDLLSNPVKLPLRANNMNSFTPSSALRFPSSDSTMGRLLTPPNSSSPQWSSVFSPLHSKPFLAANLPHNGSDASAKCKPRPKMSNTNEELSQELRRFVFENMATSNSADTTDNLQTPIIQHTPSPSAFSSPVHPPGIPIPQRTGLTYAPDSFFTPPAQGAFSQRSAPHATSTYMRSTLSNPRSIPLSRLHQKRGAVKLATVPEEDSAEVYAHDSRLHAPHHFSLRTPSPLLNGLQPQSVDTKAAFGAEELTKVGKVRVKLPHRANGHGSDSTRPSDSDQSMTLQGSPKKKRPQRRRKPGVSKLSETKVGFSLGNEGPVSFGSLDAT